MLSTPAAGGRFRAGVLPWRLRQRSCLVSPPTSSGGGGEPEKARPLLVERYRDGVSKRYMSDGNSKLQIRLEKHESPANAVEDENADSLIPQAIRDFVLPAGFPVPNKCDRMDLSCTGYIKSSEGGRFGTLFDDDPKKWRMYADFIGSAGSVFELMTPLYPGYFLPLASFGNLAKAVARGFKDPSFRVIQNHFAQSGNLGEVAAKVPTALLHFSDSYVVCNEEENILTWEKFLHPRISFGVPMDRMIGGEESSDKVNRLLMLYKSEKYVLFVEKFGSREPTFLVTFKEAATSMSVLRSLWQAHWLQKYQQNQDEVFSWLEDSILALEHGFTDFLEQMERAGWDQNQIILKVPKEPVLVSEHLD
nr:unnamed protein product [Digitaria exilis]